MKKFLALLLATMMIGAMFTGCSGKGGGSSAGGKKPTIGVCIYKYDDTYISTVRQALEDLAKDKATLLLNDGKGDQATQNDQIDLLIEKKVDCLVVNMVDIGAAQTVIDKAKAAKIPLVFFNREPDSKAVKSYDKARFVGTTAKDAGIIQGEMAVKLWGDGSKYDVNKDGKMSYVLLQGEPNNPEAIARTEYAVKTIAGKNVKVEELGLQVCDWDTAKAQVAMEAWLNKYNTKIEMVLANNDGMAQGAIAALQAIGYNKEKDSKGYIPVFGVDATDAAKDLIAKGCMSGTVLQDAPGMAKAVFELSMNSATGKEPLADTSYKYDDTGVCVRIPYQPYNK
ncbi:galactose ABC transporter substrate-binding protein [Paludicola sp. MB14-C6]|uniref:galactose ABC transporter substrate-binding protein n=1 Tax=Paludihabitans sp. MB14-C6 TaxID=3070656 RepID=UPI0027DB2075|nr:galactose ABC transporter substrate-binding protein [Paludicola sp. MB14-C6]WMJ21836.1 galactose ABC transporter substrate-binding protein [Paludicola sp. MB14-C6]